MTLAHDMTPGTKPPPGLRMSYEEFLQTTFDHAHYEWVDGEAVEMAGVEDEHGDIQTFLTALLSLYLELRPVGRIKVEPTQLKVGPDSPGRSPDLMFIATANLERIGSLCVRGSVELVVEIISPGSRQTDLVTKFAEYERAGVGEYWIIDPFRRRVDWYTLVDGRYQMIDTDDDGKLHSKVLPGVWFRDAWFFERPAKLAVLKEWGAL